MKDEVEDVGVLYLNCSEENMKKRIMHRGETSGRSDDNEEVFNKRIKVFIDETTPIVNYYKELKKVFEVDANGTIDECFEFCKKVIERLGLDKM